MTDFEDYGPLPGDNIDTPPAGAPEGQLRTTVNDTMRVMMAAARSDWEGSATGGGAWRNVVKDDIVTQGSSTSVIVDRDVRAFFPIGRKVKVTHAAGPAQDAFAFVLTSVEGGGNTTITLTDFDTAARVDADINGILFSSLFGGVAGHEAGRQAYQDSGDFVIPQTQDAAGINAAMASAQSTGKIVLLEGAYTIETTLALYFGVKVWGANRFTTVLTAHADLVGPMINGQNVVTGSDSDEELRWFRLDGNAAGLSAPTIASTGIELQDGPNQRMMIDGIVLTNIYSDAIALDDAATSPPDIRIQNCMVESCGGHGINLRTFDDVLENVYVTNCSIAGAGTVGETRVTAAGIFASGRVSINNVSVEMNQGVAHTGAGIELNRTDPGATPSVGSQRSQLTNFQVVGTGTNVAGLRIGGNRCQISNGQVELSGASAVPLDIDGRGAAVNERSARNIINGCNFEGGVRCEIAGDAEENVLSDCIFDGQTAENLRIDGSATKLTGCVMDASAIGIEIRSGPSDVDIQGCTIKNQSNDAIVVRTGATDCVITNNTIRDITDDGIVVDSGAVRTVVKNNILQSVIGDEITDAGTDTIVHGNSPQVDDKYFARTSGNIGFSITETDVAEMTAITFPGLGANGIRTFQITAALSVFYNPSSTTDVELVLSLYMGPNGTKADTLIQLKSVDDETASISDLISADVSFLAEVTPATGDKIGFSIRQDNAQNQGTLRGGTTFGSSAYIRKVSD